MDTQELQQSDDCNCCEISAAKAQAIKDFSPDGLAMRLQQEIDRTIKELDFLNKKITVMKASIDKLKQP